MRYIGGKTDIIPHINDIIQQKIPIAETFCDIFAGTGVVGKTFKPQYTIISNDLLTFSSTIQQATIRLNEKPTFLQLARNSIEPLTYLNDFNLLDNLGIDKKECFIYNNYSPAGNRMYLQEKNSLHIDYTRIVVNKWYTDSFINEDERAYLVACIVEGVPYVSNISGTYGAYLKHWDKRTYNAYQLVDLPVIDNKRENTVYNEDANELITKISGNILYLDPPYNGRQYISNYHLLETVVRYDYPTITGVTGQPDYAETKSDYCKKTTAKKALTDLIEKADFDHIILSYSTEGIIPPKELSEFLQQTSIDYYEKNIPYRRFKSREVDPEKTVKELLYYVKK